MILLDTDHPTVLQIGLGTRYAHLLTKLVQYGEPPATTVS